MRTAGGFESVLVANRGEIARRIFRSCTELGLATVAVFSDADERSPHVAEADRAVRLAGATPADTYLRSDLIVAAALRAGAQAVHPGYGFLAESAEFARAVEAAGLVWIGPPAAAIELMGSKVEAKRLMAASGVPVLAELDPGRVTEADLPVLIKASAGGGGRGMRVVAELAELPAQLAAARDEARRAFGDDTVFCERYLSAGRHLEIQVLADQSGTVWAVDERECSIQRRHQKVIEEAPSPLVERIPGLRQRLTKAALTAARAVHYTGAGTVEFVADASGEFYFLEMNTRLQVEHPVTESRTGLDLVRQQLRLAAGHLLPAEQPTASGCAIEVRLYAEDPSRDWQPATGTVHRFEVDGVGVRFAVGAGLRLDSAVQAGSVIGVHYDSMLAKLIGHGEDRAEVARTLAGRLATARIHGLRTNRDQLVRVLRHPDFLAGDFDTSFLQRAELHRPLADVGAVQLSAAAAALALAAGRRRVAPVLPGMAGGWRNVVSQPQRAGFHTRDGDRVDIEYRSRRGVISLDDLPTVVVLSASSEHVLLVVDGVRLGFAVSSYGVSSSGSASTDDPLVCVDSALGPVELVPVARFTDPQLAIAAGSLLAPMPGAVIRLGAAVGEPVTAGQPLLWLEAMKMEHPILAPAAGVLAELPVAVGDQVAIGDVLAVVAAEGEADGQAAADSTAAAGDQR